MTKATARHTTTCYPLDTIPYHLPWFIYFIISPVHQSSIDGIYVLWANVIGTHTLHFLYIDMSGHRFWFENFEAMNESLNL